MATKQKATKKKMAKKKLKAKKTVKSAKKSAKKVAKKKVKAKKTVKPAKKSAKKKVKKKKVKAKKTVKSAKKSAKKKVKKKTLVKKSSPKKKTKAKKSNLKPGKLRLIKQEHPHLDPAVHKIRQRLIANRTELLKLIRSSQSVERDAGDLTFSNEIDLASSLEGREMTFQLTSRDRKELKLIEDTLFRITNGTYGECESCEKKISLKRLQIMPLTSLCIECQEATEGV
jgi:RNA polymerase-binding protein DksA